MNSHTKLELIKDQLVKYKDQLEAYGNEISTVKVINSINKILKEVE